MKIRNDTSVLVVDSNPMTSETILLILAALGYQASGVEDAQSVMTVLTGVRIDVLIESYNLRTVDAAALAKNVKLIQPHVRVIVTSGSFGNTSFGHPAVDAVLQKPFSMAKLDETIQAVMKMPSRWPLEPSLS